MLSPAKVGQQEAIPQPWNRCKPATGMPYRDDSKDTQNGPCRHDGAGWFTPRPSAMVRLESELLNSRAHELTEHDGRVVAGLQLELQNHGNPAGFGVDAALVDVGTHH
jgi:hypothetical protein